MKLTAKTDLEAPVEFLHASLCDFAAWEREAIRNGIEVERQVDPARSGSGDAWRIGGPFRGRVRRIDLRVDEMIPDERIAYSFEGKAMAGTAVIETRGLSARRSRMRVTVEIKPRTLAARLFVNTLRLARRRVEERLERRVVQIAARIAERYAKERA